MSYLVIARKWRPKTFAEVIGQEHITVTLENAIKRNRVASAFIFSGPRGVGKTTTARLLAKALNCEKGPTTTPCNECSACREIARGNSIDVLEIDGASNRGIDEVRSLRESTRYTPSNLRYKIYIIDEVHMLTTEAFNALLKTLEEPPPHVIFIFATTEANKVPSTILSRCQRFDFRRIPVPQIVDQLQMICDAEKIQVDNSALFLIAKKAEGCMRDSQSLLDQVISFCGNEIKENDVIKLLGLISQDIYFDISKAIAGRDVAGLLDIAQRVYREGYDVQELVGSLAEHFHNALVLKATGSKQHLVGLESFHDLFARDAEAFTETDLLRMIQITAEAVPALRRSANAQLHFENLLIRLAKLTHSVELHELIHGISELKKKAPPEFVERPGYRLIPEIPPNKVAGGLFGRINGAGPAAKGANVVADRDSELSYPDLDVGIESVQKAWPAIIDAVKKQKISLGAFLEEGYPARLQGNRLEIAFKEDNGFHIKTLNEHQRFLQQIMSEYLGGKVVIHCVKGEGATQHGAESEVTESPATPAAAALHPKDWLDNFPLAQRLIESLGGEPAGK